MPDRATEQLRELICNGERLVQASGDHLRQLHRLLDFTFPKVKHPVTLLDRAFAIWTIAKQRLRCTWPPSPPQETTV
ncbi:hypothetical protein M5E06_31710 [Azospirillum sp. A1-3]|uniref:hypothetical protein n=1 Tax=Azospirillum sp. A1-3 TaxID=185874 RepID=UPI00207784FA|nr:hypothetical protein [Azospirillum sp. A1-3]MCM8738674.1 hypothetical protein [Azospirillum sp. A1-3]